MKPFTLDDIPCPKMDDYDTKNIGSKIGDIK